MYSSLFLWCAIYASHDLGRLIDRKLRGKALWFSGNNSMFCRSLCAAYYRPVNTSLWLANFKTLRACSPLKNDADPTLANQYSVQPHSIILEQDLLIIPKCCKTCCGVHGVCLDTHGRAWETLMVNFLDGPIFATFAWAPWNFVSLIPLYLMPLKFELHIVLWVLLKAAYSKIWKLGNHRL